MRDWSRTFFLLLIMLLGASFVLPLDAKEEKTEKAKFKVGVYYESGTTKRLVTRFENFVTKRDYTLTKGEIIRYNDEILTYLFESKKLDYIIILKPGEYSAVDAFAYYVQDDGRISPPMTYTLGLGEAVYWPALQQEWGEELARVEKKGFEDEAILHEILIKSIPAGAELSYKGKKYKDELLLHTVQEL